jgi:hypothetical protein
MTKEEIVIALRHISASVLVIEGKLQQVRNSDPDSKALLDQAIEGCAEVLSEMTKLGRRQFLD